MAMNKKIILILTMISLVVLYGCTGSGNETPDEVNFRSGSQGLEMKFLENSPPDKIFDKEELNIMIEMLNKGATDIVGGRLYTSGYDPKFIQITPKDTNFNIVGKSIFNPDGRLSEFQTFVDNRVDVPKSADSLEQNIKITACYNYETKASASVCIDQNPRSTTTKVCTPETIRLSGGQGGPIAVTEIEQESSPDQITFKISFSNVGEGVVFDSSQGLNNCHTALEYKDLDVVDVKVKLGERSLNCQPNDGRNIRLINKDAFVFCYYKGKLGDDAFTSQLSVAIDYAYRNSISKSVEIIKFE